MSSSNLPLTLLFCHIQQGTLTEGRKLGTVDLIKIARFVKGKISIEKEADLKLVRTRRSTA